MYPRIAASFSGNHVFFQQKAILPCLIVNLSDSSSSFTNYQKQRWHCKRETKIFLKTFLNSLFKFSFGLHKLLKLIMIRRFFLLNLPLKSSFLRKKHYSKENPPSLTSLTFLLHQITILTLFISPHSPVPHSVTQLSLNSLSKLL